MRKSENKLFTKAKGEKTIIEKRTEEKVWKTMTINSFAPTARGKLLGQILTEKIHECSFCRGKGERTNGIQCWVCGGKGVVSLNPPAAVCAYCKGSGEEKRRSSLTCSVCGGRGVVRIQTPAESCNHCRGTGEEPTNKLPCSVCRGKGVVTAKGEAGRVLSWQPERKEPESFSLYKPHLETQPQLQSGFRLKKNSYEEPGWSQYRLQQKEKDKKEKISLNMATIHGIAKRLIAREWARILGKKL